MQFGWSLIFRTPTTLWDFVRQDGKVSVGIPRFGHDVMTLLGILLKRDLNWSYAYQSVFCQMGSNIDICIKCDTYLTTWLLSNWLSSEVLHFNEQRKTLSEFIWRLWHLILDRFFLFRYIKPTPKLTTIHTSITFTLNSCFINCFSQF